MPSAARTLNHSTEPVAGGHLVATDGRALPLTRASLTGDARGGLMRVVLEQTFRNPHLEPLEVSYSLPLPADAAVSGFAFRFDGQRVVGEVDRRASARERFEEAVLEGRTAALLEQERSSLFTQTVGNVPPGAEVVCEVHLDQPLAFLPGGAWEWRFPTVVAPRYLGEAGRVPDAGRVAVPVADGPLPVAMHLQLSIRDALAEGARPESPAHALHTERLPGRLEVRLADERGVALDRDVVVRWRVATLEPGVSLDVVERTGRTFGLVTVVPPVPEARLPALPRDLVVLLDTSGSMGGAPLDQARRLTAALVDSLGDADQLELIEFSVAPRRWKARPVAATAANRADAQRWLARLQASGGTEMRDGILEALAPLRAGAQRQVVLITDGLIGFEAQVVQAVAERLPAGSRVHTVGVGSGVNRSLTRPVARAGRGLELVLGLGEDVEPAVRRLLDRTVAPLLTGLEVSGDVRALAPRRLPDLYAGAPALFSVELAPGARSLTVRARSAEGSFERTLAAEGAAGSAAVAALFGRELVEDLELSLAAGAGAREVDASIEALGLEFQLSTRLTSWVAVSERPTVDPRAPSRREVMPQALPYGLSAEGLGLRPATPVLYGRRSPVDPADLVAGLPPGVAHLRRSFAAGARGAPPPAAPARPARLQKQAEESERSEVLFGAPSPSLGDAAAKGSTQDEAGSEGAAPRVVTARVRSTRAGELLLEVTVEGAPLRWTTGGVVEVELEGTGPTLAVVVAFRTTDDGTYQPGQVLRLSLQVATPELVTAVTLWGSAPLRLEVQR